MHFSCLRNVISLFLHLLKVLSHSFFYRRSVLTIVVRNFLIVYWLKHIVPLLITRLQSTSHLFQSLILIAHIYLIFLFLILFYLIQRIWKYFINLLLRLSWENGVLPIINFDASTRGRINSIFILNIIIFFLSKLFYKVVHIFLLF